MVLLVPACRWKKISLLACCLVALSFTFAHLSHLDTSRTGNPAPVGNPVVPRLADGTTWYRLGWWEFWMDDFEGLSGSPSTNFAEESVTGGGTLNWDYDNGSSDMVEFHGDGNSGPIWNPDYEEGEIKSRAALPWVPYDNHRIRFWTEIEGNYAQLEIGVEDGNTGEHQELDTLSESDSDAMHEYDLSSYHIDGAKFRVIFRFRARTDSDLVRVDKVHIPAPEFILVEAGSDPRDETQDQTIVCYITPTLTNWDDSDSTYVRLLYDIDPTHVNPHNITGTRLDDQRFQFTIPHADFDWDETVYYHASYCEPSWNWRNSTPDAEFDGTETQPPAVSQGASNGNPVAYDTDKGLTFTVTDGQSGVDANTLILEYADNAALDGSATIDYSDPSFTYVGTTASVTIPATGHVYDRVYYQLRVADNLGNLRQSPVWDCAVTDGDAPEVTPDGANGDPVEFNADKVLSFTIQDANPSYHPAGLDASSLELAFADNPGFAGETTLTDTAFSNPSGTTWEVAIPATGHAAGDTIYWNLTASDLAGNSLTTTTTTFAVEDTQAPSVTPAGSNANSVEYTEPKVLSFTVSDGNPAHGPAGIDVSTFALEYADEATFASPTSVGAGSFSNPAGDTWEVTIPATGHAYPRVYFRLRVNDTEDNEYTTAPASWNCAVTDADAPDVTPAAANANPVAYYESKQLTFTIVDPNQTYGPAGVDATSLSLEVDDNAGLTSPTTLDAAEFTNVGGNDWQVTVPETVVAHEAVYYRLTVEDNGGATYETDPVASSPVTDDRAPHYAFASVQDEFTLDGLPGEISYDENAVVAFTITEPGDASGFPATYAGNAELYYVVSSPGSPPNDGTAANADGPQVPVNWNDIERTGGTVRFQIPESAYISGNRVWFWLNLTDAATPGNQNSSFETSLQYFDVVDKIAPTLTLPAFANVQYDQDQTLAYQISKEPNEGSVINRFRVYYRRNDPAVNQFQYDGALEYVASNWTGILNAISGTTAAPWEAGVQLVFGHGPTAYNFQWGDTFYLFFEVRDAAGNVGTGSGQFTIVDETAPVVTPDAGNADGTLFTANKHLSLNVIDPAYPQSAGIQNVYLYIKNGSNTVSTTPGSYDAVYSFASPAAAGGNYTFEVFTNAERYWRDLEKIAYMFVVRDKAGRTTSTPVQVFTIHQAITATYLNPAGLAPGGTIYTNRSSLQLHVNLSFSCPAWYSVDGGTLLPLAVLTGTERAATLAFTQEKAYTLRCYYFSTEQEHAVTITIIYDLTPPVTVPNLRVSYGNGFIRVDWDPLEGAGIRYRLYRSLSPNSTGTCVAGAEGDFAGTGYTDFNVERGQRYYYHVVATDQAGNQSPVRTVEGRMTFPSWVYLVIVAGIVAVVLGIVVKARSGRERRLITKTLEKTPEGREIEQEEVQTFAKAARKKKQAQGKTPEDSEGAKWTTITSLRKPEPKGRGSKTLDPRTYWRQEGASLVQQAVFKERSGEVVDAIRRYELLARSAARVENDQLRRIAETRIQALLQALSAR